ncbi:MAG: hypothetical protein JWO38_4454 [Gemmataceae bacterium]|nr:hypothetical protein [Gemmataceae bacterium]
MLPPRQSDSQSSRSEPYQYEPGHRLIRRVGRAFQARGWVFEPYLGAINLGLFRGEPWQELVVGERRAAAVAREYERRWLKRGECPLQAFLDMRAEGWIRSTIQPPGAHRTAAGWLPQKYLPKRGVVVVEGALYPTAEEAARVLVEWVRANIG